MEKTPASTQLLQIIRVGGGVGALCGFNFLLLEKSNSWLILYETLVNFPIILNKKYIGTSTSNGLSIYTIESYCEVYIASYICFIYVFEVFGFILRYFLK